jgi:hypothetical protein
MGASSSNARGPRSTIYPGRKGLSAVFQYPERLMTMTQLRAFLALAEAGDFPPPPIQVACPRPQCIVRSAIWSI